MNKNKVKFFYFAKKPHFFLQYEKISVLLVILYSCMSHLIKAWAAIKLT